MGGPGLTAPEDCMVYLLVGSPSFLIDAGAGSSAARILDLIKKTRCPLTSLSYLILTHAHIDHVGGAPFFKACFPELKIVAHQGDRDALEEADPVRTAANWYGTSLAPIRIDLVVDGKQRMLASDPSPLTLIHTPGHTPGSMVGIAERGGRKILFGQDIHGPFLEAFGSDIEKWRESMKTLLELEADVLCEGHDGIFEGKDAVTRFIRQQLRNQGI